MSGSRFVSPDQQFISFDALPYAGGKLFFYLTATSTPTPTYNNSALTIQNDNPVILDSAGNSGNVFLDPAIIYKVVLEDSLGNQIWTFDPVTPFGAAGSTTSGASWAGFAGGSPNAVTLVDSSFTYGDGQSIRFIPISTSTGPATISVNSGAAVVLDVDLSSGPRTAPAGVLVQNNVVTVTYDLTNNVFHLDNPFPNMNPLSTLAAASTVDLGTAASNFVQVTGGATINSFGATASSGAPLYYVRFSGASTIVNSAGIVCPAGTNIATAAGDTAILAYISSVWYVLFYQAAAAAVGNGTTGEVAFFAMSTAPPGWLVNDGTIYNISSYPTLAARIGNVFGGDGITTFAVPLIDGYFIRAWDNGAGIDPGRAFGSTQADGIIAHNHPVDSGITTVNSSVGAGAGVSYNAGGITGGNAGGLTETRPVNVALLSCIKT